MTVFGTALGFLRRIFFSAPAQADRSIATDSGQRVEDGNVIGLSATWACVRLLSGTIASLPLAPYRDLGGGHKVIAKDHPLYRLLHRAPNAEQTVVDFWEGGAASLELKGNMLAFKQRGVRGDVIGLDPIAWDAAQVSRPNKGGPLIYKIEGNEYGPDDVLHIRGFGGSPLGGLSTIALCAQAFGAAISASSAASKIFANGVRASGVLTMDSRLDLTLKEQLEADLQRKFIGTQNAGRPMILDGGLKWAALTINPDDAQLLESRQFSVEEICRIFGVPPHMIGHTEKNSSWGTGIEQQTLAFQKFTLRSRLKRIEMALEQQLLTPQDIAEGISIEFNLEGLLRGDSKGRSEVHQSALQNGWMTINEVRAVEGLPPVAGGEVPRMQMQVVPITEAGKQPTA